MVVSPDTILKILKVPIELDNKNQLTFNSLQEQTNYFYNQEGIIIDDITYQRKEGIVRFPAHFDDIINYNYCMYQNKNYGNKWFYAYITNMEYANDEVTLITLSTDVYQTWQFELNFKKCFVEREHVTDDTIGKHTQPESIEHGEYIIDNIIDYENMKELVYVLVVSEWGNKTPVKDGATNFGGIMTAGGAYICETQQEMVDIFKLYNSGDESSPTIDAIINAYIVPKIFVNMDLEGYHYKGQDTPYYDSIEINKPGNLNGYVPKNNKLLTFPYVCLLLSNNNGSSNNYQYELFNETDETIRKMFI